MSQANLTKTDKPKSIDGMNPLFSRSLNRVANVSDLLSKTITHKNKTIVVYFRPFRRSLYIANGAIRLQLAKDRHVDMMMMFNTPCYNAVELMEKKLIDVKIYESFKKRTEELIDLFIKEWTS